MKIVIVKDAFDPVEVSAMAAAEAEALFENVRAVLEQAASEYGDVEKVTVFKENAEGAVAVKFRAFEHASRCKLGLEGRRCAGRVLRTEFYDGVTNYKAATGSGAAVSNAGAAHADGAPGRGQADERQRLQGFSQWLDEQDSGSESGDHAH